MKHGNIVHLFWNADLRCGHRGLAALALSKRIKVSDLSPGEYVVFMNQAKNKVKIYASSNIIAYMRSLDNRVLSMQAIRDIPKVFLSQHSLYGAELKIATQPGLTKRVNNKKHELRAA